MPTSTDPFVRLSDAGYMLLGSIDEVRRAFEDVFGAPLPIAGLSEFEIALSQATSALYLIEGGGPTEFDLSATALPADATPDVSADVGPLTPSRIEQAKESA